MSDMTVTDLVRVYFPDASDELCDYILWEFTGFPSFLGGPDPVATLKGQLAHVAEIGLEAAQQAHDATMDTVLPWAGDRWRGRKVETVDLPPVDEQ